MEPVSVMQSGFAASEIVKQYNIKREDKMDSIISMENVCKTYSINEGKGSVIQRLFSCNRKIIKAINEVSFDIKQGEIVGYIGPNGAGKSTTIKLLTGIIAPSMGEIKILGKCPQDNRKEISKKIGVVFGQKSQLWWDIPVIDTYRLLRAIYKIDEEQFNGNINRLDEILGIKDLLYVPVRQLSLGQRMKCDIVASLLHEPSILLLDEPTIGVDATTKNHFRRFIKQINKELNTTIILTTHDLQDVLNTCDRMILMNKGELIYDGTISLFIEKKHCYKQISFDAEIDSQEIKTLLEEDYIRNVSINDNHHTVIEFDDTVKTSTDIYCIISSKYEFSDFTVSEESIESIIENYIKEQ